MLTEFECDWDFVGDFALAQREMFEVLLKCSLGRKHDRKHKSKFSPIKDWWTELCKLTASFTSFMSSRYANLSFIFVVLVLCRFPFTLLLSKLKELLPPRRAHIGWITFDQTNFFFYLTLFDYSSSLVCAAVNNNRVISYQTRCVVVVRLIEPGFS